MRKRLLIRAIATLVPGPRPSAALGIAHSGRRMHEVPIA
jgi:hypothetical protein